MRLTTLLVACRIALAAVAPACPFPQVLDQSRSLTYKGVYQSGVEAFLGIRYGQNTSGSQRYKPPQPFTYPTKTTVKAQKNGPACPQPLGARQFPVYLSNITEVSEDCLLLNIKRPNGTNSRSKLPVMVFIHGGSFIGSSKDELVTQPNGLILESVANGSPILHVSLNYRLGSFGFAQSAALKSEGSENAGLRDQRLALDWVENNIAAFGGDPDNVTIFGQSSGGLAVGMQILAFGGSKSVPFQKTIGESQMLEGGITGNFTRVAMQRLLDAVKCNTAAFDSPATISCLRKLTTQQLLDAQTSTYRSDPSSNIGDEWLPVVDGDFVPEPPSSLVAKGKFAKVTSMIGWANNDGNIIVPMTIRTANDTSTFLRDFLPGFTRSSLDRVEAMYPVSEFGPIPAANLTAEFSRSSRIFRDIVFVCIPFNIGQAIAAKGMDVYYYDQNQTFLNPALSSIGLPDLGPVHTAEFAYVFGNLSHYDVDGFPFKPNASDKALLIRESRSWSSFAAWGRPANEKSKTLKGWSPAYARGKGQVDIFVIGGPQEGLSAQTKGRNMALNAQKLEERCAFFNSPEIIRQLNY